MGFIADGIEDGRRVGKEGAKPVDDQAFQIAGRYTPAGRTVPSGPRDEGGRDIVSISCSLLDRVGRCQALAGRIKYQTGKQAAAEREFRILMRSSPVGRVRPPSKELKRRCRYSSER